MCLLNYGVDFAFFLKNRYCRYHIGHWDDNGDWENKVLHKSMKWVLNSPTVKITDNSRYVLLDMITGKYRSNTIQSWQQAALILGLLESNNKDANNLAHRAACCLLDQKGQWKTAPVAVDAGMLSYSIMKATKDAYAVKPAMDYMMKLVMKNVNEQNMIAYTGGIHSKEMYVDTLGLVCPFLVCYANTYGMGELEDLAVYQLTEYHKYGMLPGTVLPNHAFHLETKLPLGVYGWGRGTAWYLLGLMDTYLQLRKEKNKKVILEYIREAAEYLKCFQRKDGGFGATLQREDTYDSSATAAMAWFFAECSKILDDTEYIMVKERAIEKIKSVTRITGAIDWCQGDTKGIGIFAQTYDIMPFAQGMLLRALYCDNK